MVIVLLGILAAVGSNMLSDSFTTTRMVNANNASEAEARYAVERLAREIREVKYDTSNSQYCIVTPSSTNMIANKLAFYKTTSGASYNSTCATNADVVTITKPSDTDLVILNGATLAAQVGSFTLEYLDINGCPTTLIDNSVGTDCTTPGGIKFVVINLTVNDSVSGQSIAQRVRVALRNS